MSEEDDDDGRARKDNAGKDHKPSHAKDSENALRGSVGMERTFGPTLGAGSSKQHQEPSGTLKPGGRAQEASDNRPLFMQTGDETVDRDAKKTHRMIGMDDPRHSDGEGVSGPKRSQSNFSRAFDQARGPDRSRDKDRSL